MPAFGYQPVTHGESSGDDAEEDFELPDTQIPGTAAHIPIIIDHESLEIYCKEVPFGKRQHRRAIPQKQPAKAGLSKGPERDEPSPNTTGVGSQRGNAVVVRFRHG
jgi:hypothetical protein